MHHGADGNNSISRHSVELRARVLMLAVALTAVLRAWLHPARPRD